MDPKKRWSLKLKRILESWKKTFYSKYWSVRAELELLYHPRRRLSWQIKSNLDKKLRFYMLAFGLCNQPLFWRNRRSIGKCNREHLALIKNGRGKKSIVAHHVLNTIWNKSDIWYTGVLESLCKLRERNLDNIMNNDRKPIHFIRFYTLLNSWMNI